MSGANLIGVNLKWADLTGATIDSTTQIFLTSNDVISCPWNQLDADKFEELCYDVMSCEYNPKEISKMGKANSRDDGRDIVFSTRDSEDKSSIKWIIQCKLISHKNGSLTASKVHNIVDTIECYGADGYGIMTSGVIDSKLYDRLDEIGRRRRIEIVKFSRLELERWLAKHPDIRATYLNS